MNWFSHRVFAVGVAAMCKFDLAGMGIACLGSTIPDSIDFFLTKIGFSFNKIHRKHSHAWIWYALLLFLLYTGVYPFLAKNYGEILQFTKYALAFFLGIFSHIFLDMLTVKGVPIFINPNKKIAFKLVSTNTWTESVFIFLFFTAACFYLYLTNNPYVTAFIDFAYRQL